MKAAQLSILLIFFWSNQSYADEKLREESRLSTGYSTVNGVVTEGELQLNIIPIPGGSFKVNGTKIFSQLALKKDNSIKLTKLKAYLLMWSHLHFGGFVKDNVQGINYDVKLLGAYIPFRIWGNDIGESWGILHVGGDIGFGNYGGYKLTEPAICGGTSAQEARFDTGLKLSEGFSLSGYAQILNQVILNPLEESGNKTKDILQFSLGGNINLDIMSPGIRKVPRTNPSTGEVTYRKIPNPGVTFQWQVLNVDGSTAIYNSTSSENNEVKVTTGLSLGYF